MAPTVLLVEDNPANTKLATMLLERAGYRVLHAEYALDGIALAREHMPQLALMDIQLPGMDGLEATRALKADPATRRIPVVALTAFAMKEDERRIRAAGCDGYIAKPIDYKLFLAEVARWLAPGARTIE
jgi:two-component system, cell cycle response regulator DivK